MLTSQNMNIIVLTELSVFGPCLLPSSGLRKIDGGSEPMRTEKACLCEPVTVSRLNHKSLTFCLLERRLSLSDALTFE